MLARVAAATSAASTARKAATSYAHDDDVEDTNDDADGITDVVVGDLESILGERHNNCHLGYTFHMQATNTKFETEINLVGNNEINNLLSSNCVFWIDTISAL